MAKVFVSYSRKDIEFAKRLTGELQKSDLDFWIDWEGIPPTVDWWREIEKGIEEADVFLFLISSDSSASKVCGKEIDCAVKNAKRIIPLVVRDIKGDEAPKQLSHLNWIFFRASDDFDAAVKKLTTAIQTDYEWAATHRRLQVKALDWERNSKENGFLLRGMDLLDAEQDLATNTSKDPHPTDLQREYVLASRKSTDRQRRTLTSMSIIGVIALAALAVFGIAKAIQATANATAAAHQAATAESAKATAVSSEGTAVANKQEAEKQAKIALARQLASQAQTINATRNSKQMTAILLSAESMKLFHNGEAASFLINHNLPVHLNSMMNLDGNVNSVAFSPDGAYVVSGGNDATARVWNTATGKEVARVTMQGRVTSVAFSPDGKYVVTGGCDTEDAGTYVCTKGGSVRVWEALTGKEISRVTHDIEVLSVAFSPDGTHIVSGGCDEADSDQICRKGLVKVSEAVTGKEIARMIHDATVRSVAFNPDGKYVASGSDDFTARVWEIATGKEVAHKTFDGNIQAIAFSDDGKYVVAVGGKTVLIWEATTDHEVARVTYDNMTNIFSAVWAVDFSPDGRYVVTGSDDYTARVLETATGKELSRVTHDGSVKVVAFSPDGKYIVSGSLDGTARMWNANTGKEVARMTFDGVVSSVSFSSNRKHVVSAGCDKEDLDGTCYKASVRVWERISQGGYANPIDFSLNGKYIAEPSGSNTITIWEIATQKEVISVPYDGEISFIFLSPEGTYVILGSMDGVAHVWEIAAQKEIAHMDGVADSLALSRDGKYIITGSNHDYDARVWETTTGNEIARMTHNDIVRVVAFSPDGKYVASTACDVELEWPQAGCKESSVRVWEPLTGKEVARLIHENYAFSLAFSPDGRYVISGSWDNTARVLEISTNKEVARFTHGFVVSSVAFSPNGKYAVTASYDRTVRVWEVATWKEIMRIMHDSRVNSAAISPDGKYVVSGSHDHTTRVWELLTGKEVARIVQEDDIDFVVFSPDGKYIATSGENGTRLWKWQADDIISDACQYVTRNLTFAEWNQYIGDAWPYPTKQEDATCTNLPIDLEVSITPTATP